MILALDYGERFIGVAITDPQSRLALRHSVIDQKKGSALDLIRDLARKEKITTVIVGVPVSLEGEVTNQTNVSLAFIEKLRAAFGDGIDVIGVDETLTSVEAERRLLAEGGRKDDAHAEAARIMLEEYLRNLLS